MNEKKKKKMVKNLSQFWANSERAQLAQLINTFLHSARFKFASDDELFPVSDF